MEKTKKIVLILMIAFLLVNVFNYNKVYAKATASKQTGPQMSTKDDGAYQTPADDPIKSPDYYDPSNSEPSENDTKIFTDKVGVILGAIRNFSVVVSVIALMVIGLKYMIGSVEEKANYKSTLMPYVIGVILAASGTTLVSFIYNSVH